MKEKNQMKEKHLHHMCHEHLDKEVEIITVQGEFTGKLVEVGKDAIIIESTRMYQQPRRIFIRIETIVAIYQVDPMPRGPFDFFVGPQPNANQQQTANSSSESNE